LDDNEEGGMEEEGPIDGRAFFLAPLLLPLPHLAIRFPVLQSRVYGVVSSLGGKERRQKRGREGVLSLCKVGGEN
jgi:hypothetical protein